MKVTSSSIAAAALAAVSALNPVTGELAGHSHHRRLAEKLGELFILERKLENMHAALGALVEEAKKCHLPEREVVAMVKAAGAAAGVSKATTSRVLLSAGIRQRATSEKRAEAAAEKAALTAEKAEQAVRAILSGLSDDDRAAVIARLAAW